MRELLKLLADAETSEPRTDWLDADIRFSVEDGNRNHESVPLELSYYLVPRSAANLRTGEPARLRLIVKLDKHRLVRRKDSSA
jgi:hypothetical protein